MDNQLFKYFCDLYEIDTRNIFGFVLKFTDINTTVESHNSTNEFLNVLYNTYDVSIRDVYTCSNTSVNLNLNEVRQRWYEENKKIIIFNSEMVVKTL